MATSAEGQNLQSYEWKILEWDYKPQTNKENIQNQIKSNSSKMMMKIKKKYRLVVYEI